MARLLSPGRTIQTKISIDLNERLLLVHHDDGDREYTYDRSAERALVMTKERN